MVYKIWHWRGLHNEVPTSFFDDNEKAWCLYIPNDVLHLWLNETVNSYDIMFRSNDLGQIMICFDHKGYKFRQQ